MVTNVNLEKLHQAIETRKIITLTTYAYRSDERNYIDAILDLYLEEAGRKDLKNQLSYCLHELAGNAKKANTKRVYFLEKNLNLYNESEYYIGMNNFKEETVRNIEYYIGKLREHAFYTKFQFQKADTKIKIAVRNNAPLLSVEYCRIQKKIQAAREYSTMTEAYASIEDTSEGAGLGLVMMLLMLRSLGMGEEVLKVFSDKNETVALLTIPLLYPNNLLT
jgi:hypothetical protein